MQRHRSRDCSSHMLPSGRCGARRHSLHQLAGDTMNQMHSQRGVTLVELLVGLTIGLVLSLAASSIYLATTETSRATKAHGDINETGKLALDIVGREIEKAGFYPAQYPTDTTTDKVNGAFTNTKSASTIYNAGLYG